MRCPKSLDETLKAIWEMCLQCDETGDVRPVTVRRQDSLNQNYWHYCQHFGLICSDRDRGTNVESLRQVKTCKWCNVCVWCGSTM